MPKAVQENGCQSKLHKRLPSMTEGPSYSIYFQHELGGCMPALQRQGDVQLWDCCLLSTAFPQLASHSEHYPLSSQAKLQSSSIAEAFFFSSGCEGSSLVLSSAHPSSACVKRMLWHSELVVLPRLGPGSIVAAVIAPLWDP